jgi:hypothetical protein
VGETVSIVPSMTNRDELEECFKPNLTMGVVCPGTCTATLRVAKPEMQTKRHLSGTLRGS